VRERDRHNKKERKREELAQEMQAGYISTAAQHTALRFPAGKGGSRVNV